MKFDDRAKQVVTAPGTANFNFTGATQPQGTISFDTFMTTTGDYTTYGADNGTAWETGYITKQANGTYARTVKRSTNSNSAVNFSSGPVSVFCDLPAWLLDNINYLEETVASATTTDIGAVQAASVSISGTVTITSLGTGVNKLRFVRFTGALILTHNATSLILPGAANITTAAGDTAVFISDSSGNWRCRSYARASLAPIDGDAWTANTPTVTSSGGTLTTVSATSHHKQIGKTVFYQIEIILTNNGTGTTALQVNLPVAPKVTGGSTPTFNGTDNTVSKSLSVSVSGSTIFIRLYDGTYPGVTGHTYYVSGVYEAS